MTFRKKVINSSILVLMLFPFFGNAQIDPKKEMEIKLSDNFYWGEGYSDDRQKAVEFARQDLSQKIIVRISSIQSVSELEVGDNLTSDFKSDIRTETRIELRDVMVKTDKRRDGSWMALAYLSRNDFQKNLSETEALILNKLKQAQEAEKMGSWELATNLYGEIYLNTLFFPAPIYMEKQIPGYSKEVRSFSRAKILEWLDNIQVKFIGVKNRTFKDGVEMYINLEVLFNNEKTKNLYMSLNRFGYGKHDVKDGEVSIYFDLAVENPIQIIEFILQPSLSAISDNSSTTAGQNNELPTFIKSIEIDFTTAITFDFSSNQVSQERYKLTPVLENITVFDLEWEIDGVSVSNKPILDISLKPSNQVSLRLNRNPQFQVTKKVLPNGNLETVSTFQTISTNLPSIKNRPIVQEKEDFVSQSHNALLNKIIAIDTATDLTQYLDTLKRNRLLKFGNRTDVSNTSKSYMAIVNPKANKMIAILSPIIDDQRYNLNTQEIIKVNQIQEKFSGNGPIWFEFTIE